MHELFVHAVEITMLRFESPHKYFSNYLLAPTDMLHTLLSGLFRDWIVYTVILGKNVKIPSLTIFFTSYYNTMYYL